MGNISQRVTLLLTLIIAIPIIASATPVNAQTITKPTIPEFTVELTGPSFDLPPTYSFNSSTGLFDPNIGYHIEYSTVKITIKNQPFSNQTNYDYLYYNVRIKPHNYPDNYWLELYHAGADGYPIQTLSDSTTIPLPVEGAQALGTTIPTGATTDIQVEAMIGHIGRNQTMVPYPYPYVFIGETSGWSNTQSVTVPPKTPFSTPSSWHPSSTPTANSNDELNRAITLPLSTFVAIIGVLTLTTIALSIMLLRRSRKRGQ